jgi:hypothetical protein
VVEDALGLKFPVPSEYDCELLNVLIKHRFQEGPGSDKISADDYELSKTIKNTKTVISSAERLLSGIYITVAIVVKRSNTIGEDYPIP